MLYFSGAYRAGRPLFGGLGAICMLHHVRPASVHGGFSPNGLLEVTPGFLDDVLTLSKERGFDVISMDEAVMRLENPSEGRSPFLVLTLDDAYRDNLTHALPVFRRHRAPFTIFAAPAIQDGTCELWWKALENVIRNNRRVTADVNGHLFDLDTSTAVHKNGAWQSLYWPVRNLPEAEQRVWIRKFCTTYGLDLGTLCRDEAMTWDELRLIAADPLCTIGAHTIHHYALAKLDEEECHRELVRAADRLEKELGKRPVYLAYPYGDETSAGPRDFRLAQEAGYRAAVTTRKGMVHAAHGSHLLALPRLSLSGDFQKLRYVDVLLSGTAFALFNRFRKLNVA
jgi:peptidoglycan/xylan/chitin deacetylase (PgdA/CDA1 family)